ncbi:D-glycero-alpha-D-manno-heptose 1-phosphate guanylyltransferase [Mucilaginibacter pineti]|uniref:D-glycero-alpha-D-manno-heptose 1-phosphate guanylyltransferase n=1 Tax=Mucilaginibacter pineti TaxID=1391627 RepID=A0A1G6ZF53_9SPHI|nr:nucleotidyltransferase family protein [Mucilaginibacter pineti]SDE01238.1 D-glycero-alpha-D-manno-heptose 1-phosphate guanylyltransferase [Mucilaginibacter pineti]
MIKEAIVLAGGFGTRLQSVVKDVPKPMAIVAGKPFLSHVLHFLKKNNVKKVVLAVGYKYQFIESYVMDNLQDIDLEVKFSIENEPLGTGGGIYQAFNQISGESAFVLNGDTFFDTPLQDLAHVMEANDAEIVFALKKVANGERYGTVKLNENSSVADFSEKSFSDEVVINGGQYLMNRSIIDRFPLTGNFSIEKDVFQRELPQIKAFGKIYDGIFIDIGIPTDFEKAQNMLQNVS